MASEAQNERDRETISSFEGTRVEAALETVALNRTEFIIENAVFCVTAALASGWAVMHGSNPETAIALGAITGAAASQLVVPLFTRETPTIAAVPIALLTGIPQKDSAFPQASDGSERIRLMPDKSIDR